jgi:phytanoyl-CoA hydroxylase
MTPMSADPSELRQQYDRDGFVVVREFLDADELSLLQRELQRYITQVVPHLPDSDAFYVDRSRPETLKQLQHMGGDPFFAEYRRHRRWGDLAAALIGESCDAQEPEWFNKPPGTSHETPPHQDNFYFCLQPPHVATLWLALDSVDTENGCLRYVAGSHRRGFRPHQRTQMLGFSQGIVDYGPEDESREVVVALQPGDLVAHHGMTIHRAEANRSTDRHRRAFAMVYRGASCTRDEDAQRRYQESLASQHQSLGLAGS